MTVTEHRYAARVEWTGSGSEGTSDYANYSRGYRVAIAGKPDLVGSADAAFRGDPGLHNPEDLFVVAIAACHMLSYLALCAQQGVCVLAYEDSACGAMRSSARGGGRFETVVLAPVVTVASEADTSLAIRLHEAAHARCFIANSCSVRIHCDPVVRVAEAHSAKEGVEREGSCDSTRGPTRRAGGNG
jgi:organic hydroperoxide reductase OsmC/OhrA